MAVDPSVVINLAAEYTGNKAFKQADTAVKKLNKSVKGLARTFGITFGTAAVIAYGKASVKAFVEDDNAARSLGITLKNLGLETGNTSAYVNEMISNLEKQTGVLDDQLRPAMDRLLRATGSVSKATTLLGLALDISAGTGKDLTTVSQGLQKAFLGNNASLGRLGVGLSKAELTSSSFEEIQVRLSELFAGQASSAAESYAGQLNKLTIAGNNAKEVIGKGIVQALTESSGSFSAATSNIEQYSESISDLIVEFGRFFRLSNAVPSIFELLTDPVSAIKNFNKVADEIDALRAKDNAGAMGKNPIQSGSYLKNQKESTKNQKTLTKLTQDQLKLAKAKAIFDIKNIQIEAALKGKISEEERARLLLMKAIADENISLIDKYTKALAAAQAETKKLQNVLENVKTTKFENPAGTAFYNGLTQAEIDLEKFKERGGFRLKWDASDYYRGLTQGEIDLEKFKEKGGFRLKMNATDYYAGLTQSEIDLEKFKEKGGFRLKMDATNYYAGLTQSEIELERFKESGQFRLTWDATDFYRGMTAAQITWERWKESGYTGGRPGSPAPTSNMSNFSNVSSLPSNSTQNTNSNMINNVFNINTGIGDPNAIAEAVNQVLQDAVDRGTLRTR